MYVLEIEYTVVRTGIKFKQKSEMKFKLKIDICRWKKKKNLFKKYYETTSFRTQSVVNK